jgi:hypothetical protein
MVGKAGPAKAQPAAHQRAPHRARGAVGPLELERLSLGIEGRRLVWQALRHVAELDPRLAGTDFDELIRRAERQRAALEPYRVQAALDAVEPPPAEQA